MKRALLVGIDKYKEWTDLDGCVNDVKAVSALLAKQADGSANFQCRTLTSKDTKVTRREMLAGMDQLLGGGADVALF